ncbi:hypothetical protein IJD34_00845 [bacterium]|nr:hypothetical protein [bacterium]
MTNNIASKKNISSMQVLKTLLVLMENNYTMQELIQKLNEKESNPVFNNSVVSKYINTCRYCGFEINKFYNKYYVTKVPFGLELAPHELDLIQQLQSSAKLTLSAKPLKIFNEFLLKISQFSNKRLQKVQQKTYELTKELFKKAIEEKRYISLLYRTKIIRECQPIDIIESDGKIKFNVIYNNKQRSIIIERLTGIQIQENKFAQQEITTPLSYKIYNPLAERYEIKENERLTEKKDDYIVIVNDGEPKDELYSRLLRYDSLCEIITFKPRQEMKNIITKMLENYGE